MCSGIARDRFVCVCYNNYWHLYYNMFPAYFDSCHLRNRMIHNIIETKLLLEVSVKLIFTSTAVNFLKVFFYKLISTSCRFNNIRVGKKIIIKIMAI